MFCDLWGAPCLQFYDWMIFGYVIHLLLQFCGPCLVKSIYAFNHQVFLEFHKSLINWTTTHRGVSGTGLRTALSLYWIWPRPLHQASLSTARPSLIHSQLCTLTDLLHDSGPFHYFSLLHFNFQNLMLSKGFYFWWVIARSLAIHSGLKIPQKCKGSKIPVTFFGSFSLIVNPPRFLLSSTIVASRQSILFQTNKHVDYKMSPPACHV